MIRIAIAKLALLCLLVGCASSDKLELLAGSGQEALVRDSAASLISAKKNVVMLQVGDSEVVSGARPRSCGVFPKQPPVCSRSIGGAFGHSSPRLS